MIHSMRYINTLTFTFYCLQQLFCRNNCINSIANQRAKNRARSCDASSGDVGTGQRDRHRQNAIAVAAHSLRRYKNVSDNVVMLIVILAITRSSAVAEKPHDASRR